MIDEYRERGFNMVLELRGRRKNGWIVYSWGSLLLMRIFWDGFYSLGTGRSFLVSVNKRDLMTK